MFVVFFIFHVALRTRIVSEGYKVERLRSENRKLESRLYNLKAEKNTLMGPRGLEKKVREFAAAGIHFENPISERVIFVPVEGIK